MRKKALCVLVMGIWWKGELLPSILILTSLFSMILSNATCFVKRMPWRWPLRCLLIVSSESGK